MFTLTAENPALDVDVSEICFEHGIDFEKVILNTKNKKLDGNFKVFRNSS